MTNKGVRLMIPGPVDVEDEVLAALAEPTLPHYGPGWLEIYNQAVEGLRVFFGTQDDLFLIPGAGSAGLDAALGSMLRTGEKVLVPSNGFFGKRMGVLARGYGLDVRSLEVPLGRPLDPEAIRRSLSAEPDIQALALVHLETSTGVLNPLAEIAAVARDLGVPVIADAVSTLGGVPVRVDEWGLDVCVTVINKCLACPPGIAPVSVSSRAWRQIEQEPDRGHGWYLNLHTWKEYSLDWASWHPYPTTLPTNNIVALVASLRRILVQGLEAHFAGYIQAAQKVRDGLKRLGFQMFADEGYCSPLLTAVRGLPGMDIEGLRRFLETECRILIGGGLEELHGRVFRVGHIGKAASPDYCDQFLEGVEAYLRRSGNLLRS